MTIDMTNNRVPYGLLTDEEQAALYEHEKAGGTFEIHAGTSWWPVGNTPWHHKLVLRTVPLPAQRSGLGNADKDADGLREKAYQVYINEVTPNGNSRMDNITTCAGPNEGHQRHIATQVDMAFQAGWSAADRAEALTAKLSKAVEALQSVVQHEVSIFWGPDAEKNKRASWRGVMRKIKATLTEIEGEKG